MAILELDIALHLTRLAMLVPGDDAVRVLDLARPDAAAEGVSPRHPGNRTDFGAQVDVWRKSCGIPRPSSVSRASVLAATVCRPLLAASDWNPARLAITTASTTSATWCAVSFDSRGLAEGWDAVSPLLLPSTLPSALATQVAMALGARGFALAFLTGLLGLFHAIEAAMLGLGRGDAQAVLVIAADERSEAQILAHRALDDMAVPDEFAGALALERGAAGGFRICFIGYGDTCAKTVPDGWKDVVRYEVIAPHPLPSMQNGPAFRGIVAAVLVRHPRAVVSAMVPGIGSASIGLELVS